TANASPRATSTTLSKPFVEPDLPELCVVLGNKCALAQLHAVVPRLRVTDDFARDLCVRPENVARAHRDGAFPVRLLRRCRSLVGPPQPELLRRRHRRPPWVGSAQLGDAPCCLLWTGQRYP